MPSPTRRNDLAVRAIAVVWQLYGLPYRWGGDDPLQGFDCSGLVVEMLQSVGVLPHGSDLTADGLWRRYPRVQAPERGALALFGSATRASHVGIVLDVLPDRVLMIEAGGGGSSTTDAGTAARQNAYIKVRPVTRRDDFLGYVDPFATAEG